MKIQRIIITISLITLLFGCNPSENYLKNHEVFPYSEEIVQEKKYKISVKESNDLYVKYLYDNKKSKDLDIVWKEADALCLPFKDCSFSAVAISFGLRNTVDYEKVLSEMIRVVKKDGSVYCLDSFVPDCLWIQPFYKIYFKYIMPLFGGGKKYYKEYVWLYESTQQFLKKKELILLYEKLGLKEIKHHSKMFGVCVMIQGKK